MKKRLILTSTLLIASAVTAMLWTEMVMRKLIY